MKPQIIEKIEKEVEKKAERRDKKKKTKMKVSGAGVKKIARLIGGK